MKKRFLCGECGDGFSKVLELRMKSYTIEMTICPGLPEIMEAELEKESYDAIFFFAPDESSEYTDFVRRISGKYPGLVIYTAVIRETYEALLGLVEAGASRCFATPVYAGDMCSMLAEDLSPFGEGLILKEIDDFLSKNRFSQYMQGYRFMAIALENSIRDPSKLFDMENRLYPYIAENMLTTPEFVEHSIAKLRDNALVRKWDCDGYVKSEKLTNLGILAAMADKFSFEHLSEK